MSLEELDKEGVRKVSWLSNVCNQVIYAGFIDESDEVDLYLSGSCQNTTRCFQLAEMIALAPVESSQKQPL